MTPGISAHATAPVRGPTTMTLRAVDASSRPAGMSIRPPQSVAACPRPAERYRALHQRKPTTAPPATPTASYRSVWSIPSATSSPPHIASTMLGSASDRGHANCGSTARARCCQSRRRRVVVSGTTCRICAAKGPEAVTTIEMYGAFQIGTTMRSGRSGRAVTATKSPFHGGPTEGADAPGGTFERSLTVIAIPMPYATTPAPTRRAARAAGRRRSAATSTSRMQAPERRSSPSGSKAPSAPSGSNAPPIAPVSSP